MQRQGNCVLDESSYSSPVPLIGLYILGATLVCLLLILVDVFAGFRNRKRWLPCHFFSLNSVTLTLLSIALKLPVDLTSSMPRVQDQLSKLTGTTLLCICMGFFMPSLGTCRESECFTNMVALTIFVVTVVVNICIQMRTGVIILFRAEHIAILCCMMILLMALWNVALEIHRHNEASHDAIKENFVKGQKSLLYRLKMSYLCTYNSNPQFTLCRQPLRDIVFVFCVLSSVALLKASLRTFVSPKLNFCEGSVSVYKWSMTFIVVTQIITIITGILAVTFRQFSWIGRHSSNEYAVWQHLLVEDAETTIACNPILRKGCWLYLIFVCKKINKFIVKWISIFAAMPFIVLDTFLEEFNGCCNNHNNENPIKEAMEELNSSIPQGMMRLDEWILRNSVNDMERWIKKAKSLDQLVKILSKAPPSHRDDSPLRQLKARYDLAWPREQISSLSIVLLVRIATISLPSSLCKSLLSSLDEVFEVLLFVDRKMSSSISENRRKYKLAKSLWENDLFDSLLPKLVKKYGKETNAFHNQSQLDQAIGIIDGLEEVMHRDVVRVELARMTAFILGRAYESIEELHDYIEQLYIEMVNEFLVPLPNAIFQAIIESNVEDSEKTVKFALKVLCKMEKLETLVQWSYPAGTSLTNLTTDELPPV